MSASADVRQVDVPTTGKTNERPGTRAVAMHVRMSAYKARVVLDLVRNKDIATADEILRFSDREAAEVIRKVLRSAVANAEHNDQQIAEDLFVSACFADEGKTLRRMRPRARGRATRIRKRTCHITVIVSRMPDAELARRREMEASKPGSRAARRAGQQEAEERKRRTRRSRQEAANPEEHDHDHEGHDHDHDHEGHDHDHDDAVVTEDEVAVDDAVGTEPEAEAEAEIEVEAAAPAAENEAPEAEAAAPESEDEK
ncbi:MAG: rplV [Actinomycetia bacterium]|nr:rplV [Actinomycetes bacterium]